MCLYSPGKAVSVTHRNDARTSERVPGGSQRVPGPAQIRFRVAVVLVRLAIRICPVLPPPSAPADYVEDEVA